tara:strand:- start:128 stop:586 length:459 start_codon:yes stop_codon:yes gene_type:complete
MIINCPSCSKKFNVLDSQIPDKGRMVKCGSCGYKWFFRTDKEKENLKKIDLEEDSNISLEKTKVTQIDEDLTKKDDDEYREPDIKKKKIKSKNNINYLKLFIVFIISIVAIIVLIDTFKRPISTILPGVETYLQNLYFSLIDIKLFIKDLIK